MTNMLDKITGLSGGARETMRCLFFHGPTEDGNIPSKEGRGELFRKGLCQHTHGHAWLTDAGVEYAITRLCMDAEKERWQNAKRRAA